MRRILGEDSIDLIFDLIISERDLFTEASVAGRYSKTDSGPEVKKDKQTEVMLSYRESLASLPKIDDLALDLETCEAHRIQDLPMLAEKTVEWEMMYRKMAEVNKVRYVITLLRRQPKK